jgi:death-on-curing family protein
MSWIPDVDTVVSVHNGLTQLFKDEDDPISPSGVKSSNMLESACARPHVGIGNIDKYTNLELKLAALFHSLTKNHPFHNGNKRTALVTLLTALDRNNRRLDNNISDNDIFDFVVSVTANEFPDTAHALNLDADGVILEIAQWIKKNSISKANSSSGMKIQDFIKKCESLGATVKDGKGGNYIISCNGDSIRFSKSTRQIDSIIVKRYLQKLRLSEIDNGISMDEFQKGVSDEKSQIYRFIAALKRLAKT